jgi:hypothetical protein
VEFGGRPRFLAVVTRLFGGEESSEVGDRGKSFGCGRALIRIHGGPKCRATGRVSESYWGTPLGGRMACTFETYSGSSSRGFRFSGRGSTGGGVGPCSRSSAVCMHWLKLRPATRCQKTWTRGSRILPTSRKLHVQPIWLNLMGFDEVDENGDIDLADLDHLGGEEALRRRHV